MVLGFIVSLCLLAPVDGPVARPYVAPACPYCPGNRAIDYRVESGDGVVAPVSGTIRFVGRVAGVGYVTVDAEGHLVTVGGLDAFRADLVRGGAVGQGERLGSAAGDGVSLSLRRVTRVAGAERFEYVDPTPSLGRAVPRRARLVSVDRPRRAGRNGRAVCVLAR